MLKCDEAESDLSAYLDGELTPGDRARLEAHLVVCEKCNAVLTELENARGALQKLERTQAPAALQARVAAAIKNLPHEAKASSSGSKRSAASITSINGASAMTAQVAAAPVNLSMSTPLPLRPRPMTWTGLFASCAALVLVVLMIYSVSGTLDSGPHNRAAVAPTATPTVATPAHAPSIDQLAAGNPAVARAEPKQSLAPAERKKLLEQQKPGASDGLANAKAEHPANAPEFAAVEDAKKHIALADKAPSPRPFKDAFKIDNAGGEKSGLREAGKDESVAEEKVARAKGAPQAPTLGSDKVLKALNKDLYDPKVVDAELFKKDGSNKEAAAVAAAPVPPVSVPKAAAEVASNPDRDSALDAASKRESVAAKANPVAKTESSNSLNGFTVTPALPGSKVPLPPAAVATATPPAAVAPPSDPAGRLRALNTQDAPSTGAQTRREQAQATGQNTQIFGGGFSVDNAKGKKAPPPVVVLRSENVDTMIDKVQAIAKARGLVALREVASAPEPAAGAPKPAAPKKFPAPQAVLTVTAPVYDRDVLFDLFSLQDPKATVDAIVQRGSQSQNAFAMKKSPTADDKGIVAPILPVPDAADKFEDRYSIRIEIFSK